MLSFAEWYKKVSGGKTVPTGSINGSWFAERGLPIIVSCTVCGATCALPTCWIDDEDYIYCSTCVGEEPWE